MSLHPGFLLSVLAGCHVHVSHQFLPSDRPIDEDVAIPGARVEDESCRRFVFGLPVNNEPLSPADQLDRVAGGDTIVRLGIEQHERRSLFVTDRCIRITGWRVAADSVSGRDDGGQTSGNEVPEPSLVGWPSMPLGSRLTGDDAGNDVDTRPDDIGDGFLGLEVSDVVVEFEDGIALRTTIDVPPNASRVLIDAWGTPDVDRSGDYRWRANGVTATLSSGTLSFELVSAADPEPRVEPAGVTPIRPGAPRRPPVEPSGSGR